VNLGIYIGVDLYIYIYIYIYIQPIYGKEMPKTCGLPVCFAEETAQGVDLYR